MESKKFSFRFDTKAEAYVVIVTETNEATAMFGNGNHAEMFTKLLNKEWSIVTASVEELEVMYQGTLNDLSMLPSQLLN